MIQSSSCDVYVCACVCVCPFSINMHKRLQVQSDVIKILCQYWFLDSKSQSTLILHNWLTNTVIIIIKKVCKTSLIILRLFFIIVRSFWTEKPFTKR